MVYTIVHTCEGRLRLRCGKWMFTEAEAYGVVQELKNIPGVMRAEVRIANGSILVLHDGTAFDAVIAYMDALRPCSLPVAEADSEAELAALDNRFQMRLMHMCLKRGIRRFVIPFPLRKILQIIKGFGFVARGLHALRTQGLTVDVLDAVAITAALVTGNNSMAGSVMFLLQISDLIADYTHARTQGELKRNLGVCIETVWVLEDGEELQKPLEMLEVGNLVIVRSGNMIAVDGKVVQGEAFINEASMTGESTLVHKTKGASVFAGTVVDEGEIVVCASSVAGDTRINRIADMVANSQDLKAQVQSHAETLADRMVPLSLGLFLFELLVMRNVARAMSVLMVDYSCAIKLSLPIAVMSSLREAAQRGIVVKGGCYLEAFRSADTIVFDKTGTLTCAVPTVSDFIVCESCNNREELIKQAACLEEHFPHSVARAIVEYASNLGLHHPEEEHADLEYIVAHGIASTMNGKRVCIGSEHFIFDDEGVIRPDCLYERLDQLAAASSTVYMSVGNKLAAVICISDPLRFESAEVVRALRKRGFKQIIMLTGDSEACACHVSNLLGLDAYKAQMLPEDKAAYIAKLKEQGHSVVMVGDGINDSPALAAADVSVALSDASDIAQTVADISVRQASLEGLLTVRDLSVALMDRVESSYRFIIVFNSLLIALGLTGILQATQSAILHNLSTVVLSAANTRGYLPEAKEEHENDN